MNNMNKSENAVRDTKKQQCIECGEWFEIDIKNTESERCPECYSMYRKNCIKENMKRYRKRKKSVISAEPQKRLGIS